MDNFVNSKFGLKLGLAIAKYSPPWLGYAIARLAGRWIGSRSDSDIVHAVQSNQWVVSGEKLEGRDLDRAVRGVLGNSARSVYELYHYLPDLSQAGHLFIREPRFQLLIDRPKFDQRGLVVGGLHMAGFDLALQYLCRHWVEILGLTIPDPQGGRGLEFELRQRNVINLVPGTLKGLRQAIRYLDQGGMVATGIDRPVDDLQNPPRFFGRPSALPAHHIFLALKARVPVVVAASRLEEDGFYHLVASPPIEMEDLPDRDDALVHNAERVLAVAEEMIRKSPNQWLISQPVWPSVLGRFQG